MRKPQSRGARRRAGRHVGGVAAVRAWVSGHGLERDGAVGGMGRTINVGGEYVVDFGPHTFHIRETDESRAILDGDSRRSSARTR